MYIRAVHSPTPFISVGFVDHLRGRVVGQALSRQVGLLERFCGVADVLYFHPGEAGLAEGVLVGRQHRFGRHVILQQVEHALLDGRRRRRREAAG